MDLSAFVNQIVPDYIYKNYYTSGGYAFTEDLVLVHKLFVYKIPRKDTIGKVREYFSQYGNIKNVHFIPDKDRDHPYAASVYFKSPTAAARVLFFYHKSGVDRAKAYFVEVCDSWHQPNCQPTKDILRGKCIRTKKIGEDHFEPPNRDSILFRNDDCLENIIRLLPISSQLHLARSSSRICHLFQMTSKSLYRTLYLEHLVNMTQWEIRDFFDFVGDYIIRIKGKLPLQNHQRILKFMSKFCINIEELDLDSCLRLRSELLRKLKKLKLSGRDLNNLSPTIESLSVNCVDVKNEQIISLCRSLSNLKQLNLWIELYKTDAFMTVSCQNLETLTLSINQSYFFLDANMPKLKKLTVCLPRNSYVSNSTLLTHLFVTNSLLLEFLCIDGINCVSDNEAQQISRLKALRTLNCQHSYELTDVGLKYLSGLEHLEEIILSHCYYINSTALINLVLKCEKLKLINLEGCILIFNNLIFDLIRKMKEQIQNRTFRRTEPVTLKAWSTSIDKDVLNDPEYKASSHLVIVDLDLHF